MRILDLFKRWATRTPRHKMLDFFSILLAFIFVVLALHILRQPFGLEALPHLILVLFAAKIFVDITFFRLRPPTIATTTAVQAKIIERVSAHAANKQNYSFMDLGAGTGQLSLAIARAVPHAHVLGVERSCFPYIMAQLAKLFSGTKNITFTRGDIFSVDCSGADAVFMYLNAPLTKQIGEKLHRGCKTGALIISHSFELGGAWPAPEVIGQGAETTLYVYDKR